MIIRRNCIKWSHKCFFSTPVQISDKIVTVQTIAEAQKVLKILNNYQNHPFACDTEVANIDVKKQGPVGNGNITCISIYGGPTIDFGKAGCGHTIWIENIGSSKGVLNCFKDWFEDHNYKKVWHNYGFDRHVMYNEGNIILQMF